MNIFEMGLRIPVLYVSIRTIEHYRSNICEKLDLHGFNELVRFAITHKSELS